jgi:hypothetical protein
MPISMMMKTLKNCQQALAVQPKRRWLVEIVSNVRVKEAPVLLVEVVLPLFWAVTIWKTRR